MEPLGDDETGGDNDGADATDDAYEKKDSTSHGFIHSTRSRIAYLAPEVIGSIMKKGKGRRAGSHIISTRSPRAVRVSVVGNSRY